MEEPGISHDGERMVPALDRGTLVYGEHIARYVLASRLVRGRRVLDLGSGTGYGSEMLSAGGASQVIGLDQSQEAVEYSLRHHGRDARFLVGDAQILPFADSEFDVVVSFETIEHVPDYQLFLRELRRVLRPGGLAVLSTPNKASYPEGNPFHLKEFFLAEFQEVVASYFKNVTVLAEDNWVTSAILPTQIMEGGEGPVDGRVRVSKVAAKPVAETLYMVALCSDAPLPEVDPHLVLIQTADSKFIMGELARRDVAIQQLTAERDSLRAHWEEIDREKERALENKDTLLAQQQLVLAEREAAIRDVREQLESIRQSLGYQLLDAYRRRVRWLFPLGSWRGLPYRALRRVVRALLGGGRLARGSLARVRKHGPFGLIRRGIGIVRNEGWWELWRKLTFQSAVEIRGLPLETRLQPLSFPAFESPKVSIVIPVYNNPLYTYTCLKSLLERTRGIPYEVIVVDDASRSKTRSMLNQIQNVTVVRNRKNIGFVGSCNRGASLARGHLIVLLNNDAVVHEGWLDSLVEVVERDRSAGIVGAKLLYPDGRLQEAGGIVWADGFAWNYGRYDDPDRPEYNYLREVDYCSGACLLVRRDVWEKMGGFDRRYSPAYYEDTDLAFATREMGYKVVYQPRALVTHFEGVTAGRDGSNGVKRYQELNRRKFIEKWAAVLTRDYFPNGSEAVVARDRHRGKRALVIDHHVPTYDRDSGSQRMRYLLQLLGELGFSVTFLPANLAKLEPYATELQQQGIHVIHEPADPEDYLRRAGPHLDLVIVSRPDVGRTYLPLVRQFAPSARRVYDTVDLHFLRESRRSNVERTSSARQAAREYRKLELSLARSCDATFVVSPVEKDILQKECADLRVNVIPNVHEVCPGRTPFSSRRDLLFIASFLHPPNEDAMLHFVTEILPLIKAEISDIKLYVVGNEPTEAVRALASEEIIITGFVHDVAPYFERCRVFVSPLRYGAGVKGKIGQSLSHGLPVVTTSIGSEGMDLIPGTHALVADTPEGFAREVVRLYRDEDLWERMSTNSIAYIQATCTPDLIKGKLDETLSELLGTDPSRSMIGGRGELTRA